MIRESTVEPGEHPYNLRKAVEKFERGYLINVLQICGGNRIMASEMLCICPEMLDLKLKKYRIIF